MSKMLIFNILHFIPLLFISSCKEEVNDPWTNKEKIESEIIQPVFPDRVFNILDYGAIANSVADAGIAIERAIDTCYASGGGTVLIPEGTFLTGPIHLKSNVNLHLEEGSILKFSTDSSDYLPLVHTSWAGAELMNYSPLIYAYKQKNIGLTGEGTIDGQASYENWWKWNEKDPELRKKGIPYERDSTGCYRLFDMVREGTAVEERIFGQKSALRPQFVQFFGCENVVIEGLQIQRSPFWIIHPIYCNNVTIQDLTIKSHGPNNDGCDPEYSKNVIIRNCLFDTGDDCIAIKSGRDEDGRRASTPSENIIVQGCTMFDGHGGVVMGSETSAGVSNVYIEDCVMNSPNLDYALRLKSNSRRGSVIKNIYMRNVEIGQVKNSVFRFNMQYGTLEGPEGNFTPSFSDIYIENIRVENGGKTGIDIVALEESPVTSLYLKDVVIKKVNECYNMDYYKNIHFEGVYCNGEMLEL